MTRSRLPVLRATQRFAIVALCAAALFGLGNHAPAVDAASPRDGSVSLTSSVPATLFVGHSKLTSTRLGFDRLVKERRLLTDASLVGGALVGALFLSRRRVVVRTRDQISQSAYFARRRGPPVLLLAR